MCWEWKIAVLNFRKWGWKLFPSSYSEIREQPSLSNSSRITNFRKWGWNGFHPHFQKIVKTLKNVLTPEEISQSGRSIFVWVFTLDAPCHFCLDNKDEMDGLFEVRNAKGARKDFLDINCARSFLKLRFQSSITLRPQSSWGFQSRWSRLRCHLAASTWFEIFCESEF